MTDAKMNDMKTYGWHFTGEQLRDGSPIPKRLIYECFETVNAAPQDVGQGDTAVAAPDGEGK
jgi:hypothetical protein